MSVRNLQGLVSFVEAGLAGSFTAAAARLDITPAAVGKNVMRLERELGVRLFNRSTRRLRLTAEGEAMLENAGDALRRLTDAVATARGAGQQASGRVRLACGVAFGRSFVLPALATLAQHHPALQLELVLENRLADLVAEGFDIAIRGGSPADSGLVTRRICALHSVLVAAPAYLRRHGTPASAAELAQHRVMGIRFAGGETIPWRFRRPSGRGFSEWLPEAQLWCSDPDAYLELAASGAGICQAGLLHAAPLLRSGRLKVVLAGRYDSGARQMMLCYPHRQLLGRRVQVVVDALWDALRLQPDLALSAAALPPDWCAGARSP